MPYVRNQMRGLLLMDAVRASNRGMVGSTVDYGRWYGRRCITVGYGGSLNMVIVVRMNYHCMNYIFLEF